MKNEIPAKYRCTFGRDPETSQVCVGCQCLHCGWNEKEALFRRMLMKENGLTLCSDGLRRLVIPARYQKEETK